MKLLVTSLLLIYFLILPFFQEESTATANRAAPLVGVAVSPQVAFSEGEKLVYDVAYFGMKTGTATFEVRDRTQMNGRAVYPIVLTAQSNDLVALFYPVDDRIESFMDMEGLYSHYIKINQRQGLKHRNKVIQFDQMSHRAVQLKNNQQEIFEIPPEVQDALSSLYYLRAVSPIHVGQSVFVDVHESEKSWKVEIRALKKESVETPVGRFQTIKTQALIRYEGLFMDKGDVFIWFTDDAKRIPVVVKTRIKVGQITATLASRRDSRL